jgi:hypothetical protein
MVLYAILVTWREGGIMRWGFLSARESGLGTLTPANKRLLGQEIRRLAERPLKSLGILETTSLSTMVIEVDGDDRQGGAKMLSIALQAARALKSPGIEWPSLYAPREGAN